MAVFVRSFQGLWNMEKIIKYKCKKDISEAYYETTSRENLKLDIFEHCKRAQPHNGLRGSKTESNKYYCQIKEATEILKWTQWTANGDNGPTSSPTPGVLCSNSCLTAQKVTDMQFAAIKVI